MRPVRLWLFTIASAILPLAGCGGDGGEVAPSPGQPAAGAGGTSGGFGGKAGAAGGGDPCGLPAAAEGLDPGALLPNVSTSAAPSGLHAHRAACSAPGVLLVRVEAAWCSPCGRRADVLAAALAAFPAGSVDVVTLLYAGPDGAPATANDAGLWRASHPQLPGTVEASVGAKAWVAASGVVPLVVVADRRTLEVRAVIDVAPSNELVAARVADALADSGGPVVVPAAAAPLVDARFDSIQWDIVKEMGAPLLPPADPTNAHADDPAAALLGQALFDDQAFGGSGVSCSTCHQPEKGFADGLPTASGVGLGGLNTPAISTAAWNRFQFWDGRADSLWAQALGPIENPKEIGGTRLRVAHRIADNHATAYTAVFGPLPDLADTKRFPPDGKPGDAAWEAMATADKDAVDRVFSNAGKAIAAMERTLRPPKTRLETYVGGDFAALTTTEKEGLSAFFDAGCVNCHHGPTLQDGAFHDILMPASGVTGAADVGRSAGVATLLADPFRGDGKLSDDPAFGAAKLAGLMSSEAQLGQQKTPSLRGVTHTGPWGHGGTFTSLSAVLAHYGRPDLMKLTGPLYSGERDVALPRFTVVHDASLEAFLAVLSGD